MKIFKIILGIVLFAFIVIQFLPSESNQSDLVPITDFILVNTVPESITQKLKTSCYDCHSNNTQYPWYNKIKPIAWLLEDHIKEGKAELNFSTWDKLSNRRKVSKLKSIINQIKDNEMPLFSYTIIHRDAIYSDEEKLVIIEYMTELNQKLQ